MKRVPEIRVTADGSHTLYLPWMDEHYHSLHGAITESRHIFIEAGLESLIRSEAALPHTPGTVTPPPSDTSGRPLRSGYNLTDTPGTYAFSPLPHHKITLLEVGFGTGLNALLTALRAAERKQRVCYVSLEKEPLPPSVTGRLNYGNLTGREGEQIYRALHEAPWDTPFVLNEWFTIEKRLTDITTEAPAGLYDLIYFDAFGPDKQPEMWSSTVLQAVGAVTRQGSVLVTYSAKGTVKRMLRSIGFVVTLLPGPPGKRVITRAVRK